MSRALLLVLGGLCLQSAAAGFHSLRYFYSSLSDPGPALPQFFQVGLLDDRPISGYNSWSKKKEPKVEWMKHEMPEYWEKYTEILRVWEKIMKADVKTVMSRVNQTRGLHSVQLMYGCEMSDDGLSSGGFFQYSYDGQDFISLDKDRLTWVAAMDPAQITQQRWNQERSIAESAKNYLEQVCIEGLKKYLQYGKEALQPVRPEVRMSHRKSGNSNTLSCFVYGFYPREIEVKWVRNGVEMSANFVPKILPNPDGTYQIRTNLDVPEGEEEMHTCQVDHSSLVEVLNVRYDQPASNDLTRLVIAAVVLFILVAVIGVFIWMKHSCKEKPASKDPMMLVIATVGLFIVVAAGAVIGVVIWKNLPGKDQPASMMLVIAAVGLFIVVAAGAGFGVVIWKKRSGKGGVYTAAYTGPGPADSSSRNASA